MSSFCKPPSPHGGDVICGWPLVNGYSIKMKKIYRISNPAMFGIELKFERNIKGFIIKYHLMCGTLASIASISFLIEPKVVPGRAGLLVTLFLVLSNFFTNALVSKYSGAQYILLIEGRSLSRHKFRFCIQLGTFMEHFFQ